MESEIKRDPRGYYTLHINGVFEGNYDSYMEAIEAYEKIIYGEKPMKASQLCVYFLMLIAAWVAILLFLGRSAWPVIVGYWLVLTCKNACDVLADREK